MLDSKTAEPARAARNLAQDGAEGGVLGECHLEELESASADGICAVPTGLSPSRVSPPTVPLRSTVG